MDTATEIEDNINLHGSNYTAAIFKRLKARGKRLTPEEAALYKIVQDAHRDITGFSLPPIAGARKTKAQHRDELGISIDEDKIEKVVKSGLMAKINKIRKDKK